MEKLSKELARYLYEISPHSGEPGYLPGRFEGLGFDKATHQAWMIDALKMKQMIAVSDNDKIVIRNFDPVTYPKPGMTVLKAGRTETFLIPWLFDLTNDGRNYRKEARREAVYRVMGILLTAILSGFFAWVFGAIASRQ
jgi:hypothetical protein